MTDRMEVAVDLMTRGWNASDDQADEIQKQIDALGLSRTEYLNAFIQMRTKQPGSACVLGKAPNGDAVITSLGTGDSATKGKELFPEGRTIYYEGDDPAGFAREMKQKFGLDVQVTLDCPSELLDEIYYSGKYPMGS